MPVDRGAAETLKSALARAYVVNPVLRSERSRAGAESHKVAIANAERLPQLDAVGEVGQSYNSSEVRRRSRVESRTVRGGGLQLTQTLFDSGLSSALVGRAQAEALAARAAVRKVEQDVLYAGVAAYLDVFRDIEIRATLKTSIGFLSEQLEQIRARHGFGDVTATDVAQMETRLADVRAREREAEGTLKASAARFAQVIGIAPVGLARAPSADRFAPQKYEDALETALRGHPAVREALFGLDAAKRQMNAVKAEGLPSINLSGAVTRRFGEVARGDGVLDAAVFAQLKVPIYHGGEVLARTRQAGEVTGQRRSEADAVQSQIRADVASSWYGLAAARENLDARRDQVRQAAKAWTGVSNEYAVGVRTTSELLDAEEIYSDAKVALLIAERERVLVSYALLRATGQLGLETLPASDERGMVETKVASQQSWRLRPARVETGDQSAPTLRGSILRQAVTIPDLRPSVN